MEKELIERVIRYIPVQEKIAIVLELTFLKLGALIHKTKNKAPSSFDRGK